MGFAFGRTLREFVFVSIDETQGADIHPPVPAAGALLEPFDDAALLDAMSAGLEAPS